MLSIRSIHRLSETEFERISGFLRKQGLNPENDADYTVIMEEHSEIAACGSRCGDVFKYLAVSSGHQGEGVMLRLIGELRKNGLETGFRNFFLLTKPKNRTLFEAMGFHAIEMTPDVLFMEEKKNGFQSFLSELARDSSAEENAGRRIGAVVANADPFTEGHLSLVREAARECDKVYLFILSEDRGMFTAEERLEMAKEAVRSLECVFVYPTGRYLISQATFPDYFLKKDADVVQISCELDGKMFIRHFAPALHITDRYVGEEPMSPVTDKYNEYMKREFLKSGIAVHVIPRLKTGNRIISASSVRNMIREKQFEEVVPFVPESTYRWIKRKFQRV